MQKTVKEWFESVANRELREKLLANASRYPCAGFDLKTLCKSLCRAIEIGFYWADTKDDWQYWKDMCVKARENEALFTASDKTKTLVPGRLIKVYIASPYTLGDVAVNVKNQLDTANILIVEGFAPFAPLLSHFQHMAHPQPYEVWTKLDNEWVLACDCLLRLSGQSAGADAEVELAVANNIPVFFGIDELLNHFKTTH